MAREEFIYAAGDERPRLLQKLGPFVGQTCEDNAAVGVRHLASDQAALLQPVDESGDPALAQEQQRGEVIHPEPALGCLTQAHQYLVLGEGEAARGMEPGLDAGRHDGVGLDEIQPRVEVGIVEQASVTSLHVPIVAGIGCVVNGCMECSC